MELEIQKGDQYAIPLTLTFNGTDVTPSNADDVRVQIGDILKSYDEGTLTYDSTSEVWLFTLSESETRSMPNTVCFQCGVKQGHSLYYSPVKTISLNESVITEVWDA